MDSTNYSTNGIFSRYIINSLQVDNCSLIPFCMSPNQSFYIAEVNLGLPSPQTFNQDIRNQAFPQIIAFATAIAGISLGVMIVKAFVNK